MNVLKQIAELRAKQRAIASNNHNVRTEISHTKNNTSSESKQIEELELEIQALKAQSIAQLTAELNALARKRPSIFSIVSGTINTKKKAIYEKIHAIQKS